MKHHGYLHILCFLNKIKQYQETWCQ